MKRKFISVLLTLVLVLSFGLVTTVPVAAQATLNVYPLQLEEGIGSAVAEWTTTEKHSGNYAVRLDSTAASGAGEDARIRIEMPAGTTLGDIETVSWWRYIVTGFAPHLDIELDLDGDGGYDSIVDDKLVIQYAYNPWGHSENYNLGNFYGAEQGAWVQTFSDSGVPTGPTAITDTTSGWATTGAAGGPELGDANFINHTLADWKLGVTYTTNTLKTINAASLVLALEIEVENWGAGGTNAYIDDIEINGVTYYGKIQEAIAAAIASLDKPCRPACLHLVRRSVHCGNGGGLRYVAADFYDRYCPAVWHSHGRGNWGCRHAGSNFDVEQLFRMGRSGNRLHALQRLVDSDRCTGRFKRRHPQLHHVPGHEPKIYQRDTRRIRRCPGHSRRCSQRSPG